MKLPARFYADLVGKPFRAGARGPSAYDCVGLVLELQRRLGRDLGAYASTPEEFHRQFRPASAAARGMFGPCREVAEPEPGCLVLLRMLEDQRHVGTMLDPWRMLHTSSQTKAATIESLLSSDWERRVLGFYVPAGVFA